MGRPRKVRTNQARRIITPQDVATSEAALEADRKELESLSLPEKRPGMIIGGRKVPYTMADMRAIYPEHTFTPEKTTSVTVNGVRVNLEADREVTLPKVFFDIYMQSRAQDRQNARLPIGVGALSPTEE